MISLELEMNWLLQSFSCDFMIDRYNDWSFLASSIQGCRCPYLIKVVFFSIVRLLVTQNHSGLSSIFGVIIPNWWSICWIFFPREISRFGFLLFKFCFRVSKDNTTLVMVRGNGWVRNWLLLAVLGLLPVFWELSCQPKDQVDSSPIGFVCFLGLESMEELDVSCPAGVLSIINYFIYLYLNKNWQPATPQP